MKVLAQLSLLAAITIATATRADAQPAADAKAADASARAHYELREYDAAITDYRHAYEALHDPLFLFDIAQSYRQLHDCDNARSFYKSYLREMPTADNRAKVEQFITEMDGCIVQAQPAPAPAPSPAAPPAPAPRYRTLQIAGVITAAVGVAVTGAAIYFSIDGASQQSQIEKQCALGCESSSITSLDREGRDANRDAIAAYIIGGTAIAAGASLILWDLLRQPETVIVTPTSTGATVSTIVRF